jgi:hypothetical protein
MRQLVGENCGSGIRKFMASRISKNWSVKNMEAVAGSLQKRELFRP